MLKLGEIQTLQVVRTTDFGVYLGESADAESVLLPMKQVPSNTSIGDSIEVFLYKDSMDRPIATINRPALVMGEVKPLKVVDVTAIGAFLDWGLEKDLLLPFKEMVGEVKKDSEILVRLYIDKSNRLCASMKHLSRLLSQKSPYHFGDKVTGRIYEFGHDFGTYVAVDDMYSAMIPADEDVSEFHIGEVIPLRITYVKRDGKLDVSTKKKAYKAMDDDSKKILRLLEDYAGELPFTEKSAPDVIQRETGMSKAAFKRAIGHLYKERKITLEGGRIRKGENI